MSRSPVPRYTPDAGHRFFIYCPENAEFFCFATAAERDQYSDTVVQAFLDDGWDETVERVVAGELSHTCVQIDRQERPPEHEIDDGGNDLDGNFWAEGWDYRCNYELQPMAPVASGDAVDPVLQLLAGAGSRHLALHYYSEALAAQIRALIAGGVDINTARRDRDTWEAALMQRLQELPGVAA